MGRLPVIFACGIFPLLLAADPTTQCTTQAIRLEHFTSNASNFSLDYPASWTVLDKPANNQVFSMQTEPVNAADQKLGVMGLRIDTQPQPGTDAQILKSTTGQMVDYLFNHGAKHTMIKSDQVGDIPARRIRFESGESPGGTTAVYIVAVHRQITYVFTIAAPDDQIEDMLTRAQIVLKSFKVDD